MQMDVLIFGGGAAGLWLLADLTRQGRSALLLEAHALGSGQTIASQGILHGGLKYTLQGLLTPAARQVRDMPAVWRNSLAGQGELNLQNTRLRSEFCYLWQTASWSSQLGMLGARMALQVRPEVLGPSDRPKVLLGSPGTVARLPEQVISPASFLADLTNQFHDRILKIDPERVEFEHGSTGVRAVRLSLPGYEALTLSPQTIVLAAGGGNARLREQLGLSPNAMQRRPLHMVLARGELPEFNGHCIDGARTRVTITSDRDKHQRVVWQIGGQVSEDGVKLSTTELVQRTRTELGSVLPGVNLNGVDWATYRVDRAEGAMPDGSRPDTVQFRREANVITAWPTKLVLAPHLSHELAKLLPPQSITHQPDVQWPRPVVASAPWDEPSTEWLTLDSKGSAAAA